MLNALGATLLMLVLFSTVILACYGLGKAAIKVVDILEPKNENA